MPAEILFDALLALLLAATLVYLARFGRRLTALRAEREALGGLVEALARATGQAERGVAGLSAAAGEAADLLQGRIDRAAQLADDLRLLGERAERAADGLEAAIAASRARPRPGATPRIIPGPGAAPEPGAGAGGAEAEEFARRLASLR